jgi:antitoxin HigA-1
MAKRSIAPVHPGVFIIELLEELGLSQSRLAKDIHVSAMRINHVVRRKRPVTAELALRLGLYFRQSPRYWLNLQSRFDMDVAEEQFQTRVSRQIKPHRVAA